MPKLQTKLDPKRESKLDDMFDKAREREFDSLFGDRVIAVRGAPSTTSRTST